ncbi:MAG: hypothetical protein CR993_03405 [Rhodobacterales bacterium]|nr:MAG: hypothetical protein CR993_03405 [Rhodobacterales bacterium]
MTADGKVQVIACGALAREILAICALNDMQHVELTCLPAELHNTPDKIAPRLAEMLAQNPQGYSARFVAYADCGSGGEIAKTCATYGARMIEGPHCYAFFEGNQSFSARGEVTSFYLTDFLARQFDAFVIKPLGLDRHPELTQIYFGNYEKLVYLAQTDDPALTQAAEQAAARLNLHFERRFTGYGDLATALAEV